MGTHTSDGTAHEFLTNQLRAASSVPCLVPAYCTCLLRLETYSRRFYTAVVAAPTRCFSCPAIFADLWDGRRHPVVSLSAYTLQKPAGCHDVFDPRGGWNRCFLVWCEKKRLARLRITRYRVLILIVHPKCLLYHAIRSHVITLCALVLDPACRFV